MINDIKKTTRSGFLHLYDPRKEGLGPYDANYINAYKKATRTTKNKKTNVRYAA